MLSETHTPFLPGDNYGRRRDGLMVRLRSASLDRQLAAGISPVSNRALAARAGRITSPARRRALAQNWAHLLEATERPPVPRSPRAALLRAPIRAAERDIRAMITQLLDPVYQSARGVAMAHLLLRDGTGPLYNRCCPVDLGAAVRDATRLMDL